MKDHLRHTLDKISWSDSYLLGWAVRPGEVRLFLQVKVLQRHPDFRDFDKTRDHGDYHLAVLSVPGASGEGLSTLLRTPEWNPELREFRDVAEIDRLQYVDGVVEVMADELGFSLSGEALLDVMNTNSADSFRRFVE